MVYVIAVISYNDITKELFQSLSRQSKSPHKLKRCKFVYGYRQKAQLPQRECASNIAVSYGAIGISIC